MKGVKPRSYVVRDTGTSIAFWLVVAVGVAIAGDSFFRGDVGRALGTAAVVALVLWTVGMVLFHPHIRYNDTRAVVTNIGRIHEIPWSRVVAVRQNLTVNFELDDGRRLRATGVTAPRDRGLLLGSLTRGKLGAGSTDFHRYADALRVVHEEAKTSDTPVVSRWDVRALALGAVLALAVIVEIIVAGMVGS